jgi:hypothetical protein
VVKNAGRETWDALKSSVDDNRIVMKGDIDIYCTQIGITVLNCVGMTRPC